MIKKFSDKLAKSLPKDLTEADLNAVLELINEHIEVEVKAHKDSLSSKVMAFLTNKKEELKELALKELENDSEIYHNAKLMEAVKALVLTNLTPKDSNTAVAELKNDNSDLNEEVKVLRDELEKTLVSVAHSKTKLKALTEQNVQFKEQLQESEEEKDYLETQINESTLKGVTKIMGANMNITLAEDDETLAETLNEKTVQDYTKTNPFLTEEMIAINKNMQELNS